MGMYSEFGTDKAVERDGVWLPFEGYKIRIARAGGANKKFERAMERATQPYRQQIRKNRLPNDIALEVFIKVFAETVVVDWEVERDGEWVKGMDGPDGSVVEFSQENVIKAFTDIPDLFLEVQGYASSHEVFRTLEEDAGN